MAASSPRSGRGEGMKMGAEEKESGFKKKKKLFLLIKKKKYIFSTSLSSPCPRQKYSRGQTESILLPLKSAANRWVYRTRIQIGATSLCSGFGAAERGPLSPEAFSSLPASAQPARSPVPPPPPPPPPPHLRFSPGQTMENPALGFYCGDMFKR